MKLFTAQKNQKGFSLVEVILATVIIVFVIFIILSVSPYVQLNSTSRRESLAKAVIEKTVEDLRSVPYSNLVNGTTAISDPRLSFFSGGSGTVNVSSCPSSICTNNEDVKKVDIQIDWTESGKAKTFKITTLISNGGL